MELLIEPPNASKTKNKKPPRLNLKPPISPVDYRRNEIRQEAFKKKYKFELFPKTMEHVEVLVMDGKNKKFVLQFFNQSRTAACCSCENFIKDEARFCVHLAAIENALENPIHYNKSSNYYKWCNTFKIRLARIPKKIRQRYAFWDPYKGYMIYFGGRLPEIDSVSTKTYKKLIKQVSHKKVSYLPKEPVDENLLKGVTLFDYQKDILSKMLKAQRAVCSMSMGLGKAQPLTSKILTPVGWVMMKDIKVGNMVIGANGLPTKVTGVFPQGIKKIFRITFSDGSTTECCDEHLWSVRNPTQKHRGSNFQTKSLNEFMFNLKEKNGNRKYHIPMVKPIVFKRQAINIDPYLLGLLLGDGSFTQKTIFFSTKDNFLIEEVFERTRNKRLVINRVKNSKYDFRLSKKTSSKKNLLKEALENYQLMGKSSQNKFIPDIYKYNSPDVRLAVLQGLMDTDGTVSKDGYTVEFYSTSRQLAHDMQEIVWSFGGKATIKEKLPKYTYKGEKRTGKLAYIVRISLPADIRPFKLKRKLEKVVPRTKYQPTRYFDKVEFLGYKEAQCISIEAKDKLYITDDYIATHNTVLTISCFAHINKYKPTKDATMLVVAPKSLKYQWGEEIKKTCGKSVLQVEKPKDLNELDKTAVAVTTYQFVTRHISSFSKKKWDVVVIDEIQFVRNKQTKSWKALNQLKSDFMFGLSGTVIENRLDDLYSIMEIISPGVLGPMWRFNSTFQNLKIKSKTKLIYDGVKNLDQLNTLLKDSIFSYSKLNLTPIQHQVFSVGLSSAQRQFHDDAYDKAKELIAKILNGQNSFKMRIMVQALLLKARQSCNTEELITKNPSTPSPKLLEFVKLIDNICIQGGEKVVVFSDWVEMLKICDGLLKTKYNNTFSSVFFTGQQNSKQRSAAVKQFQNDPKTKVFFASNAGGVGLDGLQLAARHIIHTDIPWNPAIVDQRNGRLHRIQQQKNVMAYYFMTTNTIEEHVYQLSKDKRDVRLQTLAKFGA